MSFSKLLGGLISAQNDVRSQAEAAYNAAVAASAPQVSFRALYLLLGRSRDRTAVDPCGLVFRVYAFPSCRSRCS